MSATSSVSDWIAGVKVGDPRQVDSVKTGVGRPIPAPSTPFEGKASGVEQEVAESVGTRRTTNDLTSLRFEARRLVVGRVL